MNIKVAAFTVSEKSINASPITWVLQVIIYDFQYFSKIVIILNAWLQNKHIALLLSNHNYSFCSYLGSVQSNSNISENISPDASPLKFYTRAPINEWNEEQVFLQGN